MVGISCVNLRFHTAHVVWNLWIIQKAEHGISVLITDSTVWNRGLKTESFKPWICFLTHLTWICRGTRDEQLTLHVYMYLLVNSTHIHVTNYIGHLFSPPPHEHEIYITIFLFCTMVVQRNEKKNKQNSGLWWRVQHKSRYFFIFSIWHIL